MLREATKEELGKLLELLRDCKSILDFESEHPHMECAKFHELSDLALSIGLSTTVSDLPNLNEFWRTIAVYTAYHYFQHELQGIKACNSLLEWMSKSLIFKH